MTDRRVRKWVAAYDHPRKCVSVAYIPFLEEDLIYVVHRDASPHQVYVANLRGMVLTDDQVFDSRDEALDNLHNLYIGYLELASERALEMVRAVQTIKRCRDNVT